MTSDDHRCEHTLRLLGASARAGATPGGSYHVFDCREVRWSQLLYDMRQHWATISRVFAVGSWSPLITADYRGLPRITADYR